jgi:hypothetical protein
VKAMAYPPLIKDGTLHGESKTKAEILNTHVSSVFTTEDTTNFPNLGDSSYLSVPPIRVTEQGVVKLLHGLDPHNLPILNPKTPSDFQHGFRKNSL